MWSPSCYLHALLRVSTHVPERPNFDFIGGRRGTYEVQGGHPSLLCTYHGVSSIPSHSNCQSIRIRLDSQYGGISWQDVRFGHTPDPARDARGGITVLRQAYQERRTRLG